MAEKKKPLDHKVLEAKKKLNGARAVLSKDCFW